MYIKNIRCYPQLSVEFQPGINYIHGPNGSGKTTILECLSIFAPGKSIRGANLSEIMAIGSNFCSIDLNVDDVACTLTSIPPEAKVTLNGMRSSKAQIMERFAISWLTPQIMFHFWKEGQVRRNLIDRLTSNLILSHALECAKYEKVRAQRNQAILSGSNDRFLYSALEKIMIESGLKIIQNRAQFMEQINAKLNSNKFKMMLALEGDLEHMPDPEMVWARELERNRLNSSHFGPHKTNVVIYFNKMPAAQCSTGEQQLCLISLVLTALELVSQEARILLLDDIFANLDVSNTKFILDSINNKHNFNYVIMNHTSKMDINANYIDTLDIKKQI